MKTKIKRLVSFLSAVLLLISVALTSGCGSDLTGIIGNLLSSGGSQSFEDEVTPYAFAVTMTYYNGVWENNTDYTSTYFLWQAAGWYAAYNYRQSGSASAVISEADAKELQTIINPDGEYIAIPEEWLNDGSAVKSEAGGSVSYEFPRYKQLIDDFLGVTMEFGTETGDNGEITCKVTWHYDDGTVAETAYKLVFAKSDDKYRLTGVTLPDAKDAVIVAEGTAVDTAETESESENAAETDGSAGEPETTEPAVELNFTLEDLYGANSNESILQYHSSVTAHYTDSSGDEYTIWLYTLDDSIAYICQSTAGYSGWYKNYQFYENSETGRIDAFEDMYTQDYVCQFLNYLDMTYVGETDEDIIFKNTFDSGDINTFSVNRGTLLVNSSRFETEGGYTYTVDFTYDVDTSGLHFLDSWSDGLRTVTYITVTDIGHHSVLTETFYVPRDWELFTYTTYYYDYYTAYLNEEYTQSYEYPGDGTDYTVYLTDAES